MRLGVLAKGGTDWIGGLHYTHNLIRALRTLPKPDQPEITLIVAEAADAKDHREVAKLANICALSDKRRAAADKQPPSDMDPALLQLIDEQRIDVVFPCMRSMGESFPVRWIPWIPDMQHRVHPEFFSPAECRRRDSTYAAIAVDAPCIVLSSESARADFDRAYPGHGDQLRVLPFATVPLPAWHAGDPAAAVQRYNLPPKFLLLPNQFWKHKNHLVAFEAMRILREGGRNICLACTGKPEDPRHPEHGRSLREWIREHDLDDRIRILGLLPRLDQVQLMRAATAIVQPSLFEGWSTVVEDARVLGKTIFLSDIPVHREQNPPGAVFFPPDQPRALAKAIEQAEADLPPGPSLKEEHDALESQHTRIVQYASTFMRIAT